MQISPAGCVHTLTCKWTNASRDFQQKQDVICCKHVKGSTLATWSLMQDEPRWGAEAEEVWSLFKNRVRWVYILVSHTVFLGGKTEYFSRITLKLRMHGFISNRPISEEYLLCVRHCVKHRICGYVSTLPLCRGKAFLHRFIQKLELLAESGWSELSETVSGVCLGQWKHNELFIFKVSETFFIPF